MSHQFSRVFSVLLLFGIAGLLPAPLRAQATLGMIEGRVVDNASGAVLPGARVVVEGLGAEAATDREGRFQMTAPSGPQTLVVSYLGRKDQQVIVDVTASATKHVDVQMGLLEYQETVTVSAAAHRWTRRRARSTSRRPRRTSPTSSRRIRSARFPDPNAAETTQRIPGVSITKDQGEGRYVQRARHRAAAQLDDDRRRAHSVARSADCARSRVDVVPSDLLQAIEVSKALTPDMDGDAIGGSVNLVMKQAPEKLRVFGADRRRLQRAARDYGPEQLSALTAGRRFSGGKLGAIFSVSGSETTRGNQDIEVVYTPALTLNELEPALLPGAPRAHRLHRRRRLQPERHGSVTIRGRLQPLHRRPREPPARPLRASATAASSASCAIARTSSASTRWPRAAST